MDEYKSKISFVSDYVVVDLETTGLSAEYDDIIEIAALKVSDGKVIDSFNTLCNPGYYIDPFIIDLTGITNEMLEDAPLLSDVIDDFAAFVGNSEIVGHNISFDTRFLNEKCNLEYKGIDTVRIFRKLTPELRYHRLIDMVEFYGITNENEHRALSDCEATFKCYEIMKKAVIEKYNCFEDFYNLFNKHNVKKLNLKDIKPTEDNKDPDNLLYEKHCVFTGVLEKMVRADAAQLVVNIGGYADNSVTKKTNFLILGNNDYCASIKDGKSSKQKKAEELKLQGYDIEIIPENVFYELITE